MKSPLSKIYGYEIRIKRNLIKLNVNFMVVRACRRSVDDIWKKSTDSDEQRNKANFDFLDELRVIWFLTILLG